MIFSILLIILSLSILVFGWKKSVEMFLKEKEKLPYINALKSFIIAGFGRYIPGKIWAFGGRIVILKNDLNINEFKTANALIVDTIFMMLSSFITGIPALFALKTKIKIWYFLIIIALSFILINPKFFKLYFKIYKKIFKKKNLEQGIHITWKKLSLTFLPYFLSWIIYAFAFGVFIVSFGVKKSEILFYSSIYPISWFIGFISLFSPAGIGIREGIMTLFLTKFLPNKLAISLSILSRIWTLTGELSFALFYLILQILKRLRRV